MPPIKVGVREFREQITRSGVGNACRGNAVWRDIGSVRAYTTKDTASRNF